MKTLLKTVTQSYCFAHSCMKTILKYNYFYALLIFVISKIQLQKLNWDKVKTHSNLSANNLSNSVVTNNVFLKYTFPEKGLHYKQSLSYRN